MLHSCFLTAHSLFLHSFPSLISNCLNLPFGTQGKSRRLKPLSYRHEMGDMERLSYPGGPDMALLSFKRILQISKDNIMENLIQINIILWLNEQVP